MQAKINTLLLGTLTYTKIDNLTMELLKIKILSTDLKAAVNLQNLNKYQKLMKLPPKQQTLFRIGHT